MSMTVRCLEVGPLAANCYIVSCDATKRALVIDPGDEAQRIADAVTADGLQVDYIVDTHAHPDHIGANCGLRDLLGGKLLLHEADREAVERPPMHWLLLNMRPAGCPVDASLTEGDVLEVGELRIRVLHVPGHSPGGIALAVENVVFTGDTLFADGGRGRTDFPGGHERQIMTSLRRLVTELPGDTVVYPGHGESTTIEAERQWWE
jgi:hydroxyacylglutathione hydrolase